MKLQNKIAVITGGNSGIGFATAKELKNHGARVVIIGRNSEAIGRAARELGGDTLGITADVSRVADLDRAFQTIREKAGHIDILFVNAGIAKFAPAAESTEALFDELTDANFKGAYFTMQRALPLLTEGASIVFNSSTIAHFGLPGASIYAAGKAALISLARTLAIELAGRKIRVNVVSPGPIATPIFGKLGLPQAAVEQMAAGILAQVPLNRFGEPNEIASSVVFLCSTDAAFITGQELIIDGGMAQF
ncbi:MAG TPA: SDR family oxidoreductase [Methylomirabilota bacterium]|jgi:NAD(P)-dependent dehydrogenase (short-subunit alcohol dehydrogenase family)|nr:SDR family oxidoreductase [Methylomirabilota bacterium]